MEMPLDVNLTRVELEMSLVWGKEFPNLMMQQMHKFHEEYNDSLWIKKIRLDVKGKRVLLLATKKLH